MWTRAELKNKAKDYLREFYFKAFIVALIITIFTGVGMKDWNKNNGSNSSNTENNTTIEQAINTEDGTSFIKENAKRFSAGLMPLWMAVTIGVGSLIAIFIALAAFGFGIFIGNPLEVGGRRFFVRGATHSEANLSEVGMAFRREHYLNIVWVMFYRGLLNFIFFLLLVIPGIIKHYAYAMVPYLLAEDPLLDAKSAIEISEEMTEGHKFNMFVLDLSFIGWYLLGTLFFGIGTHLVAPYDYATKAQLYLSLKGEEISSMEWSTES